MPQRSIHTVDLVHAARSSQHLLWLAPLLLALRRNLRSIAANGN